MAKQKPVPVDKNVSVTLQMLMSLKDEIGRIARSMGNTRNKDGVVNPEYTPAINSLLRYAVAHEDDYRAWVARGEKDLEITSVVTVTGTKSKVLK